MQRTLRTTLLLVALAVLLPSAATAQQHFAADEDVQLMLRYLVEDGETPGIVMGIRYADGSTRVFAHGAPGPDARALGPRSVFEIGSINKTFTGTILADMVAKGEVALEDPISKYLPEGVGSPAFDGREITLLDLATHRSGLPRLPDNHQPGDPQDPYADYTIEGLYAFLSSHELRRAPDAEGEYSNLGFGLLGHLLARAAGTSYVDLVQERILEPLGMTMTGYALEGPIAAWHTKGHRLGDVVPYWFTTEAIQGAGGLRSNMEDMLKYVEASLDAWTSPDSDVERALRAAQEFHKPVDGSTSIGLGWQRLAHEGRTILHHGGGTGGYSTLIAVDPERQVGIVRLTNTTEFGDDIAFDFIRRGAPLASPVVAVPEQELARYVGAYEVAGASGAMVVRLEDEGWLTFQAPGNVRFRLYPASDTAFYVRRTPWRFTFTKDEAGRVAGVIADLEGDERRGRKVSGETPPAVEVAGNALLELLPLAADEIPRYEGTYAIDAGGQTIDIRVFGREGNLMAQPDGQGASALLRVEEHTFVVADDRAIRLVFTVADGRASAVALHQGGGVFRGARREP